MLSLELVIQQSIRVQFGSAPPGNPSDSCGDRKLELKVIFTDLPKTAAALRVARDMARGLRARITLIATQVVPYPLPLSAPAVPIEFTQRQLQSIAVEDTAVEIFLCRDRSETIRRVLPPDSLVILGSRKTRWWRSWSWERQLARILRTEGRRVLVVNV